MANRFAQFLEPKSAEPVAPAAVGAPAAAPPTNRFQQFVSKPATPVAPKEGAEQALYGAVTGLPNVATGTADLLEKGVADNFLFRDPVTGENQISQLVRSWGNVLTGKDVHEGAPEMRPYKPSSGDALRGAMSAAKLNPNDYFPAPQTPEGRIWRMGGEGAVTSLVPLPGAQQRGWAKLVEVAKNIVAGTTGGAAAQAAMEVAPDELDPIVGVAAGLAGGIGGYGAASLPGAAVRGAKSGVDYLRPAVPTANNVERLAAERLGAAATDPAAAIKSMESAETFVPGSKPTAFQASGDVGLGSLERAMSRGDEKFKAALIDRVGEQNAARVSALESIEDTGDVGAAVQFFRDRMRTLEQHADTLYDRAEQAAKGAYEGLGDQAAGDVGEAARQAIAARFKEMNGEASALWESIDPDKTLNVVTEPLVNETAKIYGRMSPEEMLSLSPDEKAIAGIIGSYGELLPFSNFKDLRSEITRAMRKAKSFADPNDKAHRRLTMLRGAVEQAVEDSVAGKFAADASLADQFIRQAKEWYDSRVKPEPQTEAVPLAATGTDAAPGPVRSAEQGAPAAAVAPRSAGAQGLEPRPTEGGARLPENDAPAAVKTEAPGAPIAARETFPVDEGAIQSLDPMEIGVDARRFQFKEGGDEAGVTERLQGVEQWDPRLAGTALVFRDASGQDWVADGHQRMGLAKRLMENGHPPIRVNAFVLDAANGVTDAEARAIAAIKNVAEGTGTAVDAAKVMRAAKETGIDLPPLPPRSTLVRDGRALAELSPDAFGMVINEVVPASQGAIVGRLVKDPLQQEEAVRLLATLKPDNVRQAEMVVRDMLSSGTERMTRQGGLFGEEAFAGSVTLERAKIADAALQQIKQDKRLYATLVNEAERIEGSGNVLAREANETRLTTDEKAADLLQKLAFRAGPVSDELTRLARGLKAGDQTANAAARDFLGAVRRAVEGGLDEGAGSGGAGARAIDEADPSVTPRDPDTAEMFQPAPPVQSPAFKRWFGNSKVVDDAGKPLVVYHGSKSDITEFAPSKTGEFGAGVYFSEYPEVASGYAAAAAGEAGRNITPVYLSLKNPLITSDKNMPRAAGIKKLKAQGYDGVIGTGANGERQFIAFEPTQIKSTANRGTFDPNDPRILYQGKPAPWRPGEKLGMFDTEPGLEGLPQAVIPGVAPIDDAARMRSAAAKPLKGGDAAPPRGGLFDEGSREFAERQGSLFQSGERELIRDTMADRFAAAGRPPEEALAAGTVVDSFYTTMAQRTGKTVDELMAEHPLPQVQKGGKPGTLFQPAYHGSPHVFDKFDSSKIGTGEGAQAFGHGLYFAGKKDIAQHYRDMLTEDRIGPAKRVLARADGDVDAAIAATEAEIERLASLDLTEATGSHTRDAKMRGRQAELAELNSYRDTGKWRTSGRLYKVDIPDDSEMLTWDAPLSEQPDAIKEKVRPFLEKRVEMIRKFGGENATTVEREMADLTGDDFYRELSAELDGDAAASAALREAGIPGHRFLDQGSRNRWRVTQMEDGRWTANNPVSAESKDFPDRDSARAFVEDQHKKHASHNYVIYDDSRVNINEFEQNKEGPRGSIQFGDTGSLIKMFESADASTAVHESAHHFLKMFRSMAEGADVPETIAKDWRATKAWWDNNSAAIAKEAGNGVTPDDVRQTLRGKPPADRLKAVEIDRAFHEQWARGFEQYLRDGRAPNKALRGIFEQFKNWLTSVYQSAMQLNVKLSPEIRKVFDQMLASDESRAGMPKMLDEAGAKRFSDATAATREIKDVFGAKPVKQMLRRPGPTYPYEMSAEGVANNLFKAGPEGAAAIKAAVRAGAPKATIEAAAVASLKRAAAKDGTIDPAKLAAWRQKHADALREVPELDRRMGSAGQATAAMVDVAARRKEAIDQVQRSAVGKLLKVEDDADVSAVIGRMLGRDTAVKDMRSLVAEARNSPAAMAGLRRAVVDHMVSRLKTPKDALRSDTFQRYLGKNAPALSQVLTPEQMGSLRAIALDLKRASKDVRAPGGGSDTAENTAAMKRAGLTGDQPSIMGQIVRRALASGALGWLAHALQGPIVGAASGVASFLGGTVLQALRARGIAKVDDLVREAILDPELMRKLLAKAPKRSETGSADALRRWLGQNAFNSLLTNAGDEEKDWRGVSPRPRPSDATVSPEMGGRG